MEVLLNADLQFLVNDPQAEFEGAKMSAIVCDPKSVLNSSMDPHQPRILVGGLERAFPAIIYDKQD